MHSRVGLCTVTSACSPRRLVQPSVGLCTMASYGRVHRACTGPSGGAPRPAAVHTSGPVHRHVDLCTGTLACAPSRWPVPVTSACAVSLSLSACAVVGRLAHDPVVRPRLYVLHRSYAEFTGPAHVRVAAHNSRRRYTRPALCTVASTCAPSRRPVHRHLGLCTVTLACALSLSACALSLSACAVVGRLVHDAVVRPFGGAAQVGAAVHNSRRRCTRPALCIVSLACASSAWLVQRQFGLCTATSACGAAGCVVCSQVGCGAAGGPRPSAARSGGRAGW